MEGVEACTLRPSLDANLQSIIGVLEKTQWLRNTLVWSVIEYCLDVTILWFF